MSEQTTVGELGSRHIARRIVLSQDGDTHKISGQAVKLVEVAHIAGARAAAVVDVVSQTLIVDNPSGWWMTSHGRYKWPDRARRTRHLRTSALLEARRQHAPDRPGPSAGLQPAGAAAW